MSDEHNPFKSQTQQQQQQQASPPQPTAAIASTNSRRDGGTLIPGETVLWEGTTWPLCCISPLCCRVVILTVHDRVLELRRDLGAECPLDCDERADRPATRCAPRNLSFTSTTVQKQLRPCRPRHVRRHLACSCILRHILALILPTCGFHGPRLLTCESLRIGVLHTAIYCIERHCLEEGSSMTIVNAHDIAFA
eukprot:6174445-Pleurochrysis_carterae.AAC.4